MIRHCVLIRFDPGVTREQEDDLFRRISRLGDRLPGFLAASAGRNVSPETGMDKGYASGFIVDFADAAARDAYLQDPEHQRIGEQIVASAVGGVDGVLVFDLEVEDAAGIGAG
jgi:Stress responsive A/B Barrel Domain